MTPIEIGLLVVLAVAITLAVAVPKYRNWFIGAALFVAGLFGGKKLAGRRPGRDEKPTVPDTPKPELVEDPVAPIEEDLNDAHDDIDTLDSDALNDAWAEHAASATDD